LYPTFGDGPTGDYHRNGRHVDERTEIFRSGEVEISQVIEPDFHQVSFATRIPDGTQSEFS
jgi:hypothetical protein